MTMRRIQIRDVCGQNIGPIVIIVVVIMIITMQWL